MLRPDLLTLLGFSDLDAIGTNFGALEGNWLRLYVPELGLVELVRAYGSRETANDLAGEHPDFLGLVGLPILRLGEYGGDADSFWFRYPPTTTPLP